MIYIKTDYFTSDSDKVFVVSDYYNDNTLSIWGFNHEQSAIDCRTKSDVGMWKQKCIHDWRTNITEQYQECTKCGIGHAL